jgi:hypothetical protein
MVVAADRERSAVALRLHISHQQFRKVERTPLSVYTMQFGVFLSVQYAVFFLIKLQYAAPS